MMSSETSIIKKFLTIPIVENEFTIKIQDLDFTFYSDTLLIRNPDQYSFMITYCDNKLSFNLETVAVIVNVEDFINSDDISLILKYGRKITNNFILNSSRIGTKSPLDITMDDIKEYLNIYPSRYDI